MMPHEAGSLHYFVSIGCSNPVSWSNHATLQWEEY
jgi:hypothetical protein